MTRLAVGTSASNQGRGYDLPSLLTHCSCDLRDNGGPAVGARYHRMADQRNHAVGHSWHPSLAELACLRCAALSRVARFHSVALLYQLPLIRTHWPSRV